MYLVGLVRDCGRNATKLFLSVCFVLGVILCVLALPSHPSFWVVYLSVSPLHCALVSDLINLVFSPLFCSRTK